MQARDNLPRSKALAAMGGWLAEELAEMSDPHDASGPADAILDAAGILALAFPDVLASDNRAPSGAAALDAWAASQLERGREPTQISVMEAICDLTTKGGLPEKRSRYTAGRVPGPVNLPIIWGPSGSGKSHYARHNPGVIDADSLFSVAARGPLRHLDPSRWPPEWWRSPAAYTLSLRAVSALEGFAAGILDSRRIIVSGWAVAGCPRAHAALAWVLPPMSVALPRLERAAADRPWVLDKEAYVQEGTDALSARHTDAAVLGVPVFPDWDAAHRFALAQL